MWAKKMKEVLLTEPCVEATDARPLKELRKVADVYVAIDVSEAQLVKAVEDSDAIIVRLAKVTKKG